MTPWPALLLGFTWTFHGPSLPAVARPLWERVFCHFCFKVMSLQTEKPLDDSEGIRNKTTQLCCSLTRALGPCFPALAAACAPLQPSCQPRGVGPSSRWFFPALQKTGFSWDPLLNGSCDPAIKVCSGRCRRPNPQKNSICALSSVQGEERPARCVPLLLELLICATWLHPNPPRLGERPGWRGDMETRKGPRKASCTWF